MPSEASRKIRKAMVRSRVRPGVTIQQERKEWEAHAAKLPLVEGTVAVKELIGGLPCLWVSNNPGEARSVIVYAHGGGLVDGSIATHQEFASRLARTTRMTVLLVGYRLAPEHPMPAARDDMLSVYRTLVSEKGCGTDRIVVGGDSSGAGLMLSTMFRLRDAGDPMPAKAFFISGSFDATLSGESMNTRADQDPLCSYEALVDWQKYFRDQIALDSPLLSPLFADLHGLPPILLQVGDHELWLSDNLRLAEKISQSGGSADLKVWNSMWHCWPMWRELPEAQDALEEIRGFLTWGRRHAGPAQVVHTEHRVCRNTVGFRRSV
jgi:acetyl esterase/lipase